MTKACLVVVLCALAVSAAATATPGPGPRPSRRSLAAARPPAAAVAPPLSGGRKYYEGGGGGGGGGGGPPGPVGPSGPFGPPGKCRLLAVSVPFDSSTAADADGRTPVARVAPLLPRRRRPKTDEQIRPPIRPPPHLDTNQRRKDGAAWTYR